MAPRNAGTGRAWVHCGKWAKDGDKQSWIYVDRIKAAGTWAKCQVCGTPWSKNVGGGGGNNGGSGKASHGANRGEKGKGTDDTDGTKGRIAKLCKENKFEEAARLCAQVAEEAAKPAVAPQPSSAQEALAKGKEAQARLDQDVVTIQSFEEKLQKAKDRAVKNAVTVRYYDDLAKRLLGAEPGTRAPNPPGVDEVDTVIDLVGSTEENIIGLGIEGMQETLVRLEDERKLFKTTAISFQQSRMEVVEAIKKAIEAKEAQPAPKAQRTAVPDSDGLDEEMDIFGKDEHDGLPEEDPKQKYRAELLASYKAQAAGMSKQAIDEMVESAPGSG